MTGARARERRLHVRDTVFPNSEDLVYVGGQSEKGWRLMPRTMPLILTLISDLAPKGRQDGAARVYLELWFRDFGEGLVELTDQDVHAFAAGYTAAGRGARSWRECVDVLEERGFIRIAPQGSRRYGYALLIHPDKVVEQLRSKGIVPDAWYNAYQHRRAETGAVPKPPPSPPTTPPPPPPAQATARPRPPRRVPVPPAL